MITQKQYSMMEKKGYAKKVKKDGAVFYELTPKGWKLLGDVSEWC